MTRKKILVVDDDDEIHRTVSDNIPEKIYEVFKAYNGLQALNIIKKTPPDIIVLDMMMPVMDGIELMGLLNRDPFYSKIPVIVMSIKNENYYLELGLKLQADFFICKPVDMDNLLKVIDFL